MDDLTKQPSIKKGGPAENETALPNNSESNFSSSIKKPTGKANNSTITQCKEVERLIRKNGPISVPKLRDVISIGAPPPRVFELRHGEKSLNIKTIMLPAAGANGTIHTYAHYYLCPGQYDGSPKLSANDEDYEIAISLYIKQQEVQ